MATCANDDGFYSDDAEHGELSDNLRIVSPGDSLVYDGETTFPAVIQDSQGQAQPTFTISYEKRNEQDGWDALESVPVDAGTYRASATAGEGVTVSVEYAVAPAVVDSVAVTGITEPFAGEALDTSATTSTGATPDAVTWEPSADIADYGTVYTASVTVEAANANYVLSSDTITATINGEETSVVKNADGTLTISRAFPMTTRLLNTEYLDADGVTQTAENALEVKSGSTAWSDGWYVVNDDVTIGGRVNVSGDVHLILADGASLSANGGINVSSGNGLTIYAQSTGDEMGKLSAAGGTYQAGIGGGDEQSAGTITINGGTVTANGHNAGIGGGYDGAGGVITINGGVVTANGASYSAGIGGGKSGAGGTITINGGVINATGHAGGIGNGRDGATITATCAADDCYITEGLALTVSAPAEETLAYDGTAKAASLNGDYNTQAFPGENAIVYSNGAKTLTEAPVNAGTYRASVTAEGQTAYVEYTIAPLSSTA